MVEGEGHRPRVVCVCGSTRHRAAILDAVRAETLLGRIVLAPGVFSQADGEPLADDVVAMLTDLHAAKIRLADEVLVVDVDGIGEATGREVELARALGKPVRFWTPATDQRSSPIDPDIASAVFEYDGAAAWAKEHLPSLRAPLAVEVWVFDPELRHVLLVEHRWRGWVPPGGKVEPGEDPRTAARRELAEETGLRVELYRRTAAAAVRSYHPDWPATIGLSYAAIADPSSALRPEDGQSVAWTSLAEPWASVFPDDIDRMRAYATWLLDAGDGSDRGDHDAGPPPPA